jgi:hypothetical protein
MRLVGPPLAGVFFHPGKSAGTEVASFPTPFRRNLNRTLTAKRTVYSKSYEEVTSH